MSFAIFCPSNHLVLAEPHCPVCGWTRPPAGEIGKSVWGPVNVEAGMGGPGRNILAVPAAVEGVAGVPLNGGEMIGLSLADGSRRWRRPVQAGLVIRSLAVEGKQLQAAANDERSIEEAGLGRLVAVNPANGELSLLWQASGHQLTHPVYTSDLILLRTTKPELVALNRQQPGEVVWRQDLESWYSVAPTVIGEMVILWDGSLIHETGGLKAFAAANGERLWDFPTEGTLAGSPADHGQILIFRYGHKGMMALDVSTRAVCWKQDFLHLYTSPVAGQKSIFVILRGDSDRASKRHYLLQALNIQDGKLRWEAPLGRRVSQRPCLAGSSLLLASEDGWIMAFSIETGDFIWEQALGNEENPIRTELVVYDGLLLIGTYNGQVSAIQVVPAETRFEPPDGYLQKGDFASAAAALALQGNFRQAAELYAKELKDIYKALLLYEHAGLYQEAGSLARAECLMPKALGYFERSGDLIAQAEVLVEMKDKLNAARRYEKAGSLMQAAELYEDAEEFRRALDLYKQLDKRTDVIRLRQRVPHDFSDIEELEKLGQFTEAGDIAVNLGEMRKAVDLFQRAGETKREFEALQQLKPADAGAWSVQRQATLAHTLGRFKEEAHAWELLNDPQKAATAFERAARQAIQETPENEDEIASLYEQASHLYEDLGLDSEYQGCWEKVVLYRHLPVIDVEDQIRSKFREGEFNTIELFIHNTGHGIARNVRVHPGSSRFEIDEERMLEELNKPVAPGRSLSVKVHVRPKKDQVGEAVPLALEWTWQDQHNTSLPSFTGRNTTSVTVLRQDDRAPSSEPQVVNIGTFYGGDKVEGAKIGAIGQIGDTDTVQIQKGEAPRIISLEPETRLPARLCPNCHLPIRQEGSRCQECGFELPPVEEQK